jgi:hypothetical protein
MTLVRVTSRVTGRTPHTAQWPRGEDVDDLAELIMARYRQIHRPGLWPPGLIDEPSIARGVSSAPLNAR